MLDSDTKSRIDSARDILVGKVPDTKSQVEQITIALIYKFMDDMDRPATRSGCWPTPALTAADSRAATIKR
jgi:type I restriction enzyme M protein